MAPAIGLPNKVPNEEKAYSVPTRKPSFRISDIEATRAGIIASVRPDAKPYRMAYTMTGAADAAGSQMARVMTPEKTVKMMQTLKTP